jgi:HAD superfamily hydrolase (TIGR01490 family)
MTLALFDLDNTLLSGDSDYEWGNFLVQKKLVDKVHYEQANQKFYQDYKEGKLDIYEFSAFTFEILTRLSNQALDQLHQEFMAAVILPLIGDKARALVEKHRALQHTLIIITATNQFITAPIATELGIPHLIATQSKIVDGHYTTEIDGIPCFQAGKVQRLSAWMRENNETLKGSYFYSDSHNDAPLMRQVDHAIAVDPDETLIKLATQERWEIISLRDN